MAYAGLHPVFAVYATFINRAFDQVLMDCALHRAGVTFVLDRAGCHRRRRSEPQRHVGHVDPAGRPGAADRRAARRRRPCARSCARRSTSTTPRPSCASRRAPSASTCRRSSGSTASTCCVATRARRVLLVSIGLVRAALPRRSGSPGAARHRGHGRRSSVGVARAVRSGRPRARAPARRQRRGQQPSGWHRLLDRGRAARRRRRRPVPRLRHRARSSCTTPPAPRCSATSGSPPRTCRAPSSRPSRGSTTPRSRAHRSDATEVERSGDAG